MRNTQTIFALLLVLAQTLVGVGLGSRASCRDSNGVLCIDSALTSCECHRAAAVPYCDDDQTATSFGDSERAPRLSSPCQCSCTPISGHPVIVQNDRASFRTDQAQLGLDALPVPIWPPALPAMRMSNPLNVRTPQLAVLDHLESVILRL